MADEEFVVDLDALRIREIEELEEIIDGPFDQALADGRPKGKALRAIAYIVKRRENPDFTMEDAGELVIRLVGSSVDPTPAAGS